MFMVQASGKSDRLKQTLKHAASQTVLYVLKVQQMEASPEERVESTEGEEDLQTLKQKVTQGKITAAVLYVYISTIHTIHLYRLYIYNTAKLTQGKLTAKVLLFRKWKKGPELFLIQGSVDLWILCCRGGVMSILVMTKE